MADSAVCHHAPAPILELMMRLCPALLALVLAAPAIAQTPAITPAPSSLARAAATGGRVEIRPDGCERFLTRDGLDGTAEPLGGYACPPAQIAFMEAIRRFRRAYGGERNAIRLADLRQERATDLCSLIVSGSVQNWRGILRSLDRLPNGNVALSVELEGPTMVLLQTSGGQGTQLAQLTQVTSAQPIHAQLRMLNVGQKVIFWGSGFKQGPDCLMGARETEAEMMLSPRFFFRFTDIYPAP